MLAISGALSEFSYKLNECMTNKSTYKCVIHAELSNHTAVNVTLYKHQSLAHLHNILAEALNPPVKPVINSNIELTHMTSSSSSSPSSTDTYDYESYDYIPNHTPSTSSTEYHRKTSACKQVPVFLHSPNFVVAPARSKRVEIYDLFVYNGKEVNQIVSIPNDENTTLLEFIMHNPKHTQKEFSLTAMTKAYKIYIIDRTYAQRIKNCDIIV